MSVHAFPVKIAPVTEGGITHEQAMEAHRRFCVLAQAAPTVADRMGIPYEAVCSALGGLIWAGVHRHWCDRVLG